MKVLLYAPGYDKPDGPGAHGHRNMRDGLMQLGAEIIDFDFFEMNNKHGVVKANEILLKIIQEERPDVFYHGIVEEELLPEVADYITNRSSTTSMLFLSDDEWRLGHSLQHAGRYNYIVTNHSPAIEVYHQHGFRNVFHCQWACNPKYFYPVETEKEYDVSFVGQGYPGRYYAVERLLNAGINVNVWGNNWEQYPPLRHVVKGAVPHSEMLRIFSASKIVLSLNCCSSNPEIPQIKGRIFEYGACKTFQLCFDYPLLADYYELGKELVTCSMDRIADTVRYYLDHDSEREAIAEACYRRTLNEHTWIHRFSGLFNHVLSNNNENKQKFSIQVPTDIPAKRVGRVDVTQEDKVSVVCCAYNVEKYIDDMIQSVLNQTYGDFEFILLDDGSTDSTPNIIKNYTFDKRIKHFHQENIGRSLKAFDKLRNKLIELASGNLLAVMGADDIMFPTRLEKQIAEFKKNRDLDICFSNVSYIDENNNLLNKFLWKDAPNMYGEKALVRKFYQRNVIPDPSTMVKRSSIEKMDGYQTPFAADYDLWLRCARFFNFSVINEPLVYYREHDTSSCVVEKDGLVVDEAKRIRDTLRDSTFTILDFYPEINLCADKNRALYEAYLHEATFWFEIKFPYAARLYNTLIRSLQHNEHGLESYANCGMLCAINGKVDIASHYYKLLWENLDKVPDIENKDLLVNQLEIYQNFLNTGNREVLAGLSFIYPPKNTEFAQRLEESGGKYFFGHDRVVIGCS